MTTASTTQAYTVDPAHSSVEFVVRHMMIAKVRGRFTGVTGSFDLAPGTKTPTAVKASLDVATIATGDGQRDGHLKSPDFFDVEQFPTIEFASTSAVEGDDDFELHGDLTIHGTTQPIVLKVTHEGATTDPYGNQRVGFEAHGKLNRKDFGLAFNIALEAGGVAIGDEIKIELSIEGIAQK